MHITQFTDYSLRVLLYLGLKNDKATVGEISESFRISRHHLVKVVHTLGLRGFITSSKGKSGGIALAVDPNKLRLGDFVQQFEPMNLLECFSLETNTCPIQGVCMLERSLYEARSAFIQAMNKYTLADYLKDSPSRDERMIRLGIRRR